MADLKYFWGQKGAIEAKRIVELSARNETIDPELLNTYMEKANLILKVHEKTKSVLEEVVSSIWNTSFNIWQTLFASSKQLSTAHQHVHPYINNLILGHVR